MPVLPLRNMIPEIPIVGGDDSQTITDAPDLVPGVSGFSECLDRQS